MKKTINGILYDTDETVCIACETEKCHSLLGYYDVMKMLRMTKKDDFTKRRMFFFHFACKDMGFLPFLGSERIEPCTEWQAMEFIMKNAPATFNVIWNEDGVLR